MRPRYVDAAGVIRGYISRFKLGTNLTAELADDGTTITLNAAGGEGGPHNHDADYEALGHNHDADYEALGHNHDADYEALGHNHDADYEALGSVSTHAGAADPHTGYQKESEKDQAFGYAGLSASSLIADAQIPLTNAPAGASAFGDTATIGSGTRAARSDHRHSREANPVTAHEAAGDPHTGYVREADANWVDLTDGGATSLHSHAGGGGEAFPVGSVFIAVVSTNPGTLLGYGTWSAFGAGRMLVGLDSGDTDFDVVEETGGAKTHTLTESEIPSHTHVQNSHNHTQDAHVHDEYNNSATTGGQTGWSARDTSTSTAALTDYDTGSTVATNQAATATNQNTGGGGAHNNMPPYVVVYMWKRTA